jgi:CxxC-x17-CxxC domain-containing protein
MVNGVTSRPFSASTLKPFRVKSSELIAEKIVQNSRKRYARPTYAVEDEINRWSGVMSGEGGEAAVSAVFGGKYQTICTLCGKSATVPFQPTPGRPVYCSDCLAKIQSGELKPPPTEASFRGRVKEKYQSDLAALGIEFNYQEEVKKESGRSDLRSAPKRGEEKFAPRPIPPRPGEPSKELAQKANETQAPLHLADLKKEPPPKKEKAKPKTQPDVEGLREALKKALEDIQK